MKIFRGLHYRGIAPACALTIGNFDGVHRGHQAMLALLRSEALHRGLPSCVMAFEPHPRDYFALATGKPELAPARLAPKRKSSPTRTYLAPRPWTSTSLMKASGARPASLALNGSTTV